jgi:transposase
VGHLLRDERPWNSTAPPAAFYRYSPDRKGEHAEALLDRCRGFPHADGYAGFGTLYEPEPGSTAPHPVEVACWIQRAIANLWRPQLGYARRSGV